MSSSISESASASASASSGASGHSLSVGDASNPAFKIVGISLAISSGAFIGASFVIKKLGLIRATRKSGGQAGEGHAYLKNWIWWIGMTMMIIGEIANFVAYAFTEAILVTPMGALSVVICAILSHFFLKESLNFFGWIGCTLCIIGATILALNAPEQQSVTTIAAFKKLFLSPGFLVWGSLCIAISLGVVFFVAPRWGKTNMMPYIGVCSLIGGVSVSCTQGLGASIVTSIGGNNQVKNWFFWFLFVFVVITLLVEINYLNKALELFNAAMVVPVYFVTFTSATLITSFILYQGLKASAVTLITMVLGFFVICLGITLLQMSKVDPKQLTKLDRKATIFLEATNRPTEESEKGNVSAMEEPGMDALRGGFGAVGSIIRARSVNRRLSSASNYGQLGHYNSGSNLSTHGLGQLQRFQLSDRPMSSPVASPVSHEPMPVDAADRISQHARSPIERTTSFAHSLFPQRSKSSLRFEEEDVVHQYGYGKDDDAYHHYRQHPHSAPPLAVTHAMYSPGMGKRQGSTGSVYPAVLEEPETEEPEEIGRTRTYSDPYAQAHSSPLNKNPSKHSTDTGHGGKFANMFHLHPSHDPSKQVRGGAHRGMEDYPRLKTRDHATEHEERTGLVSSSGGHAAQDSIDEDQRMSYEDEPRSAVTDESFGHVLHAMRRPGPVTVTRPSTNDDDDGGATPRGSSPWGR